MITWPVPVRLPTGEWVLLIGLGAVWLPPERRSTDGGSMAHHPEAPASPSAGA
jgi:hypothetical protein